MPRNPDYDITFNCLDYDRFGNPGVGILNFELGLSGDFKSLSILEPVINIGPTTISGQLVISYPQSGNSIDFNIGELSGDIVIGEGLVAKIKWSDIGSFDFEIGRTNLAGEMPLDWRGEVWQILKLGKGVIVYGSGGITRLLPADNVYGKRTINLLGLVSKWSVTGTDDTHFFIDEKSRLCIVEDSDKDRRRYDAQITVLGYEEYLEVLTDPVLNYDPYSKLLFICDDTYGFVYSLDNASLGSGPINITGVGYSNTETFVASPAVIVTPTFEITTDILDFNTRNNKTLHELEVGTNLQESLEAQVMFSLGVNSSFVSAGWFPVTPLGVAYINCFGKEFKIGLRCTQQDDFEIDYLKVKGRIHKYNPLDA